MAAPLGNNFWEVRSKHGRDKLFKTPELMWEAATEYFQWCIDNPLKKMESVKSYKETGKIIAIPISRPFTWEGLCGYLDCNLAYFRTFKSQMQEKDKDFNTVLTRIEQTIYRQKFEGASVGIFNHNIIARDLGLADKQENKVEGNVQITGMKIT